MRWSGIASASFSAISVQLAIRRACLIDIDNALARDWGARLSEPLKARGHCFRATQPHRHRRWPDAARESVRRYLTFREDQGVVEGSDRPARRDPAAGCDPGGTGV